jgi:hypothetical protein
MKSSKMLFCITALAAFFTSAALAKAGGPPSIKAVNGSGSVQANLNVVFKMGPKGTEPPAPAITDSNGFVGIPANILSPSKPHTQMAVYQCDDGSIIVVEATAADPCPHHRKRLGFFWWDSNGTVVINVDAPEGAGVTIQGGGITSTAGGTVPGGGLPIWVQLEALPGVSILGGNKGVCEDISSGESCTNGKDAFKFNIQGALLFGTGAISAGPMVGFEYRTQVTSTLDTGTSSDTARPQGGTTSTESEGLRINSFHFGGRLSVPVGSTPFRVNVDAGEAIESLRFNETFGSGGSTSSFTDNETLTAPFIGVSVIYNVCPHIGVTGMYRYEPMKEGGSGSSQFAVHDNDIAGGITINFGGPHK